MLILWIEYRVSSNIQSRIIQGIGDDVNIHKKYTNVRLNNYLIFFTADLKA